MGKKKVVLDQFDFIRAIACLGIVLYHFAVEYGWPDILIIMLVVLPMEIFTLQYFSLFQAHYYFIIIVK